MIFNSDTINLMNETTVREEIIVPLITLLGYRFGETNYAEREEYLPSIIAQVGRKSKKDYPIGKPDYRCGVDGARGSFILEAKEGKRILNAEDVIQAHSYAAHGKINAQFFILCNGHEFRIYETAAGVDAVPILVIKNQEIKSKIGKIEALLSPANLIKYSSIKYDISDPLSASLGSKISLKIGWVSITDIKHEFQDAAEGTFLSFLEQINLRSKFEEDVKKVSDRRQPIIAGLIQRNESGLIEANLEFDSVDPELADNMAKMGIDKMMFTTNAEKISEDPLAPTSFESISNSSLPKGIQLHSGITKQVEALGADTEISLNFKANGFIKGKQFIGDFFAYSRILVKQPLMKIPAIICEYKGTFEITLDSGT